MGGFVCACGSGFASGVPGPLLLSLTPSLPCTCQQGGLGCAQPPAQRLACLKAAFIPLHAHARTSWHHSLMCWWGRDRLACFALAARAARSCICTPWITLEHGEATWAPTTREVHCEQCARTPETRQGQTWMSGVGMGRARWGQSIPMGQTPWGSRLGGQDVGGNGAWTAASKA